MKNRNSRNPMTTLTIGSLLVAAVGIFLQYLSGVGDFPTIPPGPIILVALAGVIAIAPWRWIPLAGAVMGISLVIGFLATGTLDRLFDLSPFAAFIGLWIQMGAVMIAIVSGVIATAWNYQSGRTS